MSAPPYRQFSALEALPPEAGQLLDRADGLFSSRPWFESFIVAGLVPGARQTFLVLGDGHALLPCQRLPHGAPKEPTAAGLSSFYSCDFRPLLADPTDGAIAYELGRAAADAFADAALIRFDALDSTVPGLKRFLAGLARPGRALLRYDHFGRWWESVEKQSFAAYLGRRDGALREIIRRKSVRLAREGAMCAIIPAAEIEQGIADYQAVYRASWKKSEPFPDFQPTLMRKLAGTGWLRLAICRRHGKPIAAQLWVVTGGTATVLKLAHDQEFDHLSPGTVLTAFAIQSLIEQDRIARLDFGRGDDGYKRAWAGSRTQHVGILSADLLRRPFLVARHRLGALTRHLR